jgi:GNAT superfamily N-acetyltransferase
LDKFLMPIRPYTPADAAATSRVVARAFSAPDPDFLIPLLRLYETWPAARFYLMEESGVIAGAVGVFRYDHFASVGYMVVDPDHQGKGIGRALMQHLMQELQHDGVTRLTLEATAAGAPLYSSLGFVEVGQPRAVHLRQPDVVLPPLLPDPTLRLTLLTRTDLPQITAFDTPVFGTSRHELLECLLDSGLAEGVAAWDAEGTLLGYALLNQGSAIGPCVARDAAVAEHLIRELLPRATDPTPRLILPEGNAAAVQLAERLGFAKLRSCRHMQCGDAQPWGDLRRYFAIQSFATG